MRIEVAETSGSVMTVPGSRAVMIDDAGHFLHLERPDAVNAEILAFLAE
jgi:pimeloyl-ACP methyl ester carboxylesterase